jgi:hypothetical protein
MRIFLKHLLSLSFLAIQAAALAQPQPFTLIPASGLPALAHSWVSWGDFDKDGDLDVALCGDLNATPRTYVYRNDNGFFTDAGFALPGLSSGSIEWGDMDGNGWLDLLISGADSSGATKAFIVPFLNAQPSQSPIALPLAVKYGQAHWGDFDSDGKLDILMAGDNTSGILENNGNGIFTLLQSPLPIVDNASCNWVDYNNDGQSDIFLCGHVGLGDISKIFVNDQGSFSEVSLPAPGILGMSYGISRWADLDLDGDMDLMLSGVDTLFGYIHIYRNDGSNSFHLIDDYTFNVFSTNLDIADYDSDGLPDFIICGKIHSCGGSSLTLLYRNEGNMVFSNAYTDIPGIALGGVAFGDYNGDGTADLLVSGTDSYGEPQTSLYANTAGSGQFQANTPPLPPSGLMVQQDGGKLIFRWNLSSDNQSEKKSLTYNMFIGTTPAAANVFAPLSDLSTGSRFIAAQGNTSQDTAWTVGGLEPGSYYWSVQAIDNGFMPSAFASPQPFNVIVSGTAFSDAPETVLYPNPCSNVLHLSCDVNNPCRISVMDLYGHTYSFNCLADEIDVSILPPGLYIARITTPGKTVTAKFNVIR